MEPPPPVLKASGTLSDRESLEVEVIKMLISSYFNIVRESIADQVPKAVMHLLVNHCKDVIQNRLVSELYKEALFEELLYEDDGVKKPSTYSFPDVPCIPDCYETRRSRKMETYQCAHIVSCTK